MRITVALDRPYDVVLGEGARAGLAALVAERAPRARTAVVVTSPSLAAQPWFDLVTGLDQHVLQVPEGEAAKSLATVESLCERMVAVGLSRHDLVVGVGGGATTDLAGFAAAVYLRGVAVIQIPTTLVGQVDAAIGGKTGVDLASGKNLVGAFHQPLGVLCDYDVLTTLPERERLGGLGEVAKCWLLEDRSVDDLDRATLGNLIEHSVALKAAIVASDEREGGRRALLNYGHTLAHALETLALARDVDELRHGEAVAIGLAFAARLAHALGRVDASVIAYHDEVLSRLGLSAHLAERYDVDELVTIMARDKKAHHDLTFVLPGERGYEVVTGVDPVAVASALASFRGEQ